MLLIYRRSNGRMDEIKEFTGLLVETLVDGASPYEEIMVRFYVQLLYSLDHHDMIRFDNDYYQY